MRWAWVENERIRDICLGDPFALYHPDVAVLYDTQVPDDAAVGDGWVNGSLIKQPPSPPPQPPPPSPPTKTEFTPVEFKLRFTPEERLAIKTLRTYNGTDEQMKLAAAIVDDWLEILEDPRLHVVDITNQSTIAAVNFLRDVGILTPERAQDILDPTK